MKFRSKSESELRILNDDELVAHLVEARDTGHDEEVHRVVNQLLSKRYPQQLGLVRKKVRNRQDAEDITQLVIEHALKAKFDGRHTGQFFSMLNTIRKRRVADYFKAKEREPGFAEPHPDGSDPLDALSDPDDFEAGSDLFMVHQGVLAELSERDRLIVRYRIDGYPAKETADIVAASGVEGGAGLTSVNCNTIYSRYRKTLNDRIHPDGEGQA